MFDLPFTFQSLKAAYRSGMSPRDVVEEVYRRIDAIGDPGIFICLFDREEVLATADTLADYDPENPLWGIPFVIKDNIDAGGKPTTAGCPAYEYHPDADAYVVRNLRNAGALLIGKTNLDQFATGLVGVRSPFQPPKNAVDPLIVPGGSSSGSAVAVGHGIVSFSLGTDTAGSGRVPGALNNIVGLKPTLGALSASGVVPACRSLDTISIFALTVEDAYAAYQAAAGYDDEDAYSRKIATPDMSPVPPKLRIGIPDAATIEFFGDDVQAKSFADTVALLKANGAEIEEVDFTPFRDVAHMLYEGAWVAERHTVIEDLMRETPEAVHPITRQIVGAALKLSATDTFRGIYRLKELARKTEPVLAALDLLCVPTIPTFYSVADLEADPVGPNSRNGTYTNFVNLLDMCGLAVPVAPRSDGRPGNVTLLAKAGQDALLAALGSRLEQLAPHTLGATGWSLPAAQKRSQAAGKDELALAVCGAHMSGMALNHELTGRGARFLERSETSDAYSLHALAGGPPKRPGLVRGEEGSGTSIDLEIWALPREAVGGFLAGIPAPLGLGTVELSDGRSVTGFICEAAGTRGADNITHLKSWRAYVSAAGAQSIAAAE
ncbi:allophanate hydrolase [Labrenzia sp. OB1]|uniref:allophanate hydrolase n=1 Tax=Labrenzia sp. OB1 TaxID=1561204 RepID=UPI0007B280B3|nr:allophanate hydrolase [Labrenzia sp. OB1]KZM49426.1 allophanate hydrolase [Labrenzia sp. OB1]